MTQTKLKYHIFDVGDTLEYRGVPWRVVDIRPGYYSMFNIFSTAYHHMNTEYVEMNFTKVKTFEEELNEL